MRKKSIDALVHFISNIGLYVSRHFNLLCIYFKLNVCNYDKPIVLQKREIFQDLAPLLWNSYGTIAALLQVHNYSLECSFTDYVKEKLAKNYVIV